MERGDILFKNIIHKLFFCLLEFVNQLQHFFPVLLKQIFATPIYRNKNPGIKINNTDFKSRFSY